MYLINCFLQSWLLSLVMWKQFTWHFKAYSMKKAQLSIITLFTYECQHSREVPMGLWCMSISWVNVGSPSCCTLFNVLVCVSGKHLNNCLSPSLFRNVLTIKLDLIHVLMQSDFSRTESPHSGSLFGLKQLSWTSSGYVNSKAQFGLK